MHRVTGFPRCQPVVVAPAHFVPAVLIIHGQGAQDYRKTGMGETWRADLVVQLERLFNRLEIGHGLYCSHMKVLRRYRGHFRFTMETLDCAV